MTVRKQHFNLLQETNDKIVLRDNLKAIFNWNEFMVAMDRHSGTLSASTKMKHIFSQSKETRDNIAINECVSASGSYCYCIYFFRHIHPIPMIKINLMKPYIQFLIMATWKANIFEPSSTDGSIGKKGISQSYSPLMDMGHTS